MKTKWIIPAIVVAALIGTAVYIGNTQIQKGALTSLSRPTTEGGRAFDCSNVWTKTVEGSYINNNPGQQVKLNGIRVNDIQSLARSIQLGCDMKIRFETVPQGGNARETNMYCDAAETFGDMNSKNIYTVCRSTTPLPEGTYHNPFLFDEVVFVGNNGNPIIYKERSGIGDGDGWRTTNNLFVDKNGDQFVNWKISVFLKK